jgi:hypothetical protein
VRRSALCLLLFTIPWGHVAFADAQEELAVEIARMTSVDSVITQLGPAILEPLRVKHDLLASELVSTQVDLSMEEQRELFKAMADFEPFAERYLVVLAARVDYERLLETELAPLYARYFSEEELRELRDFYRTPTGRKTLDVIPAITRDWMAVLTADMTEEKVKEILQAVVREYRADLDL